MPPIERPDTSPEGVEPVDPGIEEFSCEVLVEVVDVRRGAGAGASAGLAFSPACAAATLDATDTGFSSSSPVSSGSSSCACKANDQTVAQSVVYGKMMGYMGRLE